LVSCYQLKTSIFAAFLDLSKAFDSVWRNGLFYKLLLSGIGGNFYRVIKSIYSHNDTFCVKQTNRFSEFKIALKCLKQGDNLSPILFKLYANDLNLLFNNGKNFDPVLLNNIEISYLAYPDDIVIMSQSSTGLQNCLNIFSQYCEHWKLNINPEKSKVTIFCGTKRSFNKGQYQFLIGNKPLEVVEQIKYFGIKIKYTGNLKMAAEELYKKGLKVYFGINNILSCI
jgi:hypothetical protein